MEQLLMHLWGDYILQSDWMAQNKTKDSIPAFYHALVYSACFIWLCCVPSHYIAASLVSVPSGCAETTTGGRGATAMMACYSVKVNTPDGYLPVSGTLLVPEHTSPAYFRWLPWLAIFSTHFVIDRYRLARYVIWLKNWIAPYSPGYYEQRMSWKACEGTGYVAENRGGPPAYLQVWLLIIADNTLHLTINYLALRFL